MFKILFLSLSLVAVQKAKASTTDVAACINQKYQALTDRRGIVAAVVDPTSTQIFTFGAAKKDQIFEIGSLTKTFTATLLAQEVAGGKIKISDPIPSEYQKLGSVISYQNLTTHTSGIIGGNFADYKSSDPESPYDGLTIPIFKELYAKTPLAVPVGQKWIYSNIGEGLLGLILSEKNGIAYNDLVSNRIFKELGMTDSYFEVPTSELGRFPQGNVNGEPWSHWNLYNTAISPAGSIRSTISDMAKYARANLLPESTSLKSAVELSHQSLYQIAPNFLIGMNWILQPDKNLIWHDGSTLGFNSILMISTKYNVAVVALTDTGIFKADANGNQVMDESLKDIATSCLQ